MNKIQDFNFCRLICHRFVIFDYACALTKLNDKLYTKLSTESVDNPCCVFAILDSNKGIHAITYS
jgi:hypothetical protein